MRSPVLLAIQERPPKPTPGARARAPQPGPSGSRLRVLVADDYEDARAMFSEYLAFSGFEVAVATDGHEAVDLAQRERFDVVLMDLAMPTLDGTSALRLLRKDPRTSTLPVVACTGQIDGGEIDRARRAGFDALLIKPVLLDDLVRTLRDVASRTRARGRT